MNISQEINTANMTTSFLVLIQTSNIIENYAIRFISIAGVVLNFISLVIVLNKDLNHFIYTYIWSRFFCNSIVCATGAGYVKPCTINCRQTYFAVFYQWYLNGIPLKVALLASTMSEILLILNRVYILIRRPSCLSRFSKFQNLAMCYIFPILVAIPIYFSIRIYQTDKLGIFMWELNEFGSSIYFKVYVMVVLFMETLVPLTLLTVLNCIAAKKYSTIDPPNVRLTTDTVVQRRQAENRCTRMILIMTTVCIVTHLLDLFSAIGMRIESLGLIEISQEMSVLNTFFRQVTFLIILAAHSFDGVFIFGMDSNLRRISLKMLGSIQVRAKFIQCLDQS
jgi:hypothetical protein